MIFFSGLREADLPDRPHNSFGIDASFEKIMNIIGQVSQPRARDRYVTISFGPDEKFDAILAPDAHVLKTLEPTPIDRRRMDRIVKAALPEAWLDDLGERQIVIRGRGGVGKTVILLQMAYRAYDNSGMRSLILTYNKALVADMRRTMALLGVPRQLEKGGISIDTVHAFIGRLMHELGIIESDDLFLENYEKHKESLLDYLRSGAVSPVRASVADWDAGLARDKSRPRRLRRCLRMKSNLAHFVADTARGFNLQNWDLEPNPDANGGRVLIVEGDMANDTAIYERLRAEAAELGNYPVDLLACVPPSLVIRDEDSAYSVPGRTINAEGGFVWDATAVDVRAQYPTDRDSLRIVQYDSCRGLEGWTVINYAFDDFYDYKYRQWINAPQELGGLFDTQEDLAAAFAAQWTMIPLTRAMDTLVLNLSKRASPLKDALRNVFERRQDFIEWLRLD